MYDLERSSTQVMLLHERRNFVHSGIGKAWLSWTNGARAGLNRIGEQAPKHR